MKIMIFLNLLKRFRKLFFLDHIVNNVYNMNIFKKELFMFSCSYFRAARLKYSIPVTSVQILIPCMDFALDMDMSMSIPTSMKSKIDGSI